MPYQTDEQGNTVFVNPEMRSDNLLHNPDGRVAQRGSPNTTADDTYGGPDRWYSLTQTGSISAATGSLASYSHRITQTQAVAQRMGRAQIIEAIDCSVLQGKDVTCSGLFYIDSGQDVMVAILDWEGTYDSVTSDVVNNWTSTDYSPGNFFISTVSVIAVKSFTGSIPNNVEFELSGSVPQTMQNIIVFIWTKSAEAQNANLYYLIKLEMGSESTLFVRPNYSLEMNKCRRYFQWRHEDMQSCYAQAGGGTFAFSRVLPVDMRISPTAVAGTYTNSNITGTPVITTGYGYIEYQASPTATGSTKVSCVGTTLSADL